MVNNQAESLQFQKVSMQSKSNFGVLVVPVESDLTTTTLEDPVDSLKVSSLLLQDKSSTLVLVAVVNTALMLVVMEVIQEVALVLEVMLLVEEEVDSSVSLLKIQAWVVLH